MVEHLILAHQYLGLAHVMTHPVIKYLTFSSRINRCTVIHSYTENVDRALFVDSSSAFNSVISELLQVKIAELSEPDCICK